MTWHKKIGNPRGRNGMTKQQEYDIDNGITDENRPVCQICGKPVKFKTQTMSYNSTCSRRCANTLLSRRRHSRTLHGQERYDAEHNIIDTNRPVCQVCGKPVKFLSYSRGYARTCGTKQCHYASMSSIIRGTPQQQYDAEHNITDSNRPVCVICGKPAGFVSKKRGYSNCCSLECWHEWYGVHLKAWQKFKCGNYDNDNIELKYCKAGNHRYRSSYEYYAVLTLEKLGIFYEIETVKIPYKNLNLSSRFRKQKISYYYVDLLVYYKDIKVLVEIKPAHKIQDDNVQFKAEIAMAFVESANYDAYTFLTEHEIFDSKNCGIKVKLEQIYAQVKSQQLHKLLNSLTCQK